MTNFEETAMIIEMEIEKLYNLKKFNQVIYLCNIYHINRCEHNDCNNSDL